MTGPNPAFDDGHEDRRIPLVVGITGHRDLREEDVDGLQKKVTGILLDFRKRVPGFGKPRVTLKYGLRPVFDQIGVPWTDPPVRWLGTIITVAAVSFLVLVLLVLLIALMFAR